MTQGAQQVADYADREFPEALASVALSDAYYYSSLPLCALDAVYSIGVRYEGVQNVVNRYCAFAGIEKCRKPRDQMPSPKDQESVSQFLARFDHQSAEDIAKNVFKNRQRTSSKNGVLKAEAVISFLEVLREHGCEVLQDADRFSDSLRLDTALRGVAGQASGVSIRYFWMLAGSEDNVKPDRMIIRFVKAATDRSPSILQAEALVRGAGNILRAKYPHITPRLLDFAIWTYQRNQKSGKAAD